MPGLRWGQVYAYRAINPFDPAYGLRFDPDEAIRDIERGNGTTARKMMGARFAIATSTSIPSRATGVGWAVGRGGLMSAGSEQ